jgi:hypothetical protein
MREPTPRPLLLLFMFVGVGAVLLGLSGIGEARDCDPAFPDKCLPGILLAGRALFVAVGTAFATVGALRLLGGQRPRATWLALLAGVVESGIATWFGVALATGEFLPANSFYSIVWPVGVMVTTTGLGVAFLAAVVSDRIMGRLLR